MDLHTFKIYVSETEYFPVNLEYTTPQYTETGKFVDAIPLDYHKNSYFRSLAACYVSTFKSGISEDHLNNSISHSQLVTSTVKFHVHYQMEKFMKNPKLLDHYLTEDDLVTIRKHTPVRETWERRTLSSHANVGTWYCGLPVDVRRKIRRQHYVRTPYGGTYIEYEYLTGRFPKDVANDYKIFIPKTSRNKVSIRMGYDYFENNDLEEKVTSLEKAQQGNTAEIVKNVNGIIELNELGRNPPVQYDLTQLPGYPPGFFGTGTISTANQKKTKFIIFKVGGFEINFESQSSPYGFYEGNSGNIVLFSMTSRSVIVRTSFSFTYARGRISIFSLEFKNISSTGNVSNRNEATVLKCLLITT
ncbi:Hypothetical predicted protein [Paramuricea clavata]|uniref:Uncharacterized protein n=1 Tax=Paramuricea clavata TaxID=317549 RepID=A0A7D9D644_PARCT|nr:Hypothetical predicted protein [Paramuricea clavata]